MGAFEETRERFPEVVRNLPEADVPLEGWRGWILQGEAHQLLFSEVEPTAIVPEHTHPYPQWCVVLEGAMELTVGGEAKVYRGGENCVIPPETPHSATFLERTRLLDLFSEPSRYRAKESP